MDSSGYLRRGDSLRICCHAKCALDSTLPQEIRTADRKFAGNWIATYEDSVVPTDADKFEKELIQECEKRYGSDKVKNEIDSGSVTDAERTIRYKLSNE